MLYNRRFQSTQAGRCRNQSVSDIDARTVCRALVFDSAKIVSLVGIALLEFAVAMLYDRASRSWLARFWCFRTKPPPIVHGFA